MLSEQIFVFGGFAGLSKLPESFDYTSHIDKMSEILVKEALYNSTAVEDWLEQHNNLYDEIVLENKDSNTIPLRIILTKLTNNNIWIKSIRTFVFMNN